MNETRITFTLNYLVAELNAAADAILRHRFALTYSQFIFLVTLQNAGPTSSSGLATCLGVSRAAVSKRTDWFVSRKLVAVKTTPQDSRIVQLALTPEGDKLVSGAAAVLEEEFHRVFHTIQGDHGVDLDALHRTLTTVHRCLIQYNTGSAAPEQSMER
jgi:DNA-binding MarR family transcriptional regulator